mgnify:CR=1 FL=1
MVIFRGLFFFWLINYFSQNTKYSFLAKILGSAIIISGTIWSVYPSLVSAGWFGLSASAATTPRESSINNLPISQSQENFSPILLAVVNRQGNITNDGVLTTAFSFDDLDASMVEIPTRETITTYIVESGDTLSSIAEQFGVSTNTIRWANEIPPKSTIRVGQQLVILPITGVRHTVVKGDTISTIAKKYQADIDEVASYNNIEKNEGLKIGTIIIIPNGEIKVTSPVKNTNTSSKSTPNTKTSESSKPSSNNYFIRPIKGIKTQGFHGPYNAIDIGAPVGTTIVAAADGTVITAKPSGWNGGYGGLTIIQHANGSQSLYAHQSSINVSVGQKVSQGQKIGESGNTGRSTGPHLHLEFRGVKTPALF